MKEIKDEKDMKELPESVKDMLKLISETLARKFQEKGYDYEPKDFMPNNGEWKPIKEKEIIN